MPPLPEQRNKVSNEISPGLEQSPNLSAAVTGVSHAGIKHVGVLDGVRALCVFFVAWFHVWQQSWLTPSVHLFGEKISLDFIVRSGYIFVDGLILLSGFLLFLPYARHKAEGERLPSIRSFYIKRVMRIVPSYYFCIFIMLFFVAIPQGKYASAGAMFKDVFMHLTFTHTLSAATYLQTPLNGALWTLGVEAHAYLAFPLLALGFVKKPYLTASLMMGAGFLYRGLVQLYAADTAMWFNQFPAFLDVYALGMLSAWAYVALAKKCARPGVWLRLAATAIACAAAYGVFWLMKSQASASGYEAVRISQMNQRFFLAVALSAFMLGLSFSLRGIRVLFSNPVMKFLSAISFNYYIWHQLLAVWLKEWKIPRYISSAVPPNQAGEQPWQTQYTLLCFGLAILLATALTYGLERPASSLVHKLFHRRPKAHERPADDTIGA